MPTFIFLEMISYKSIKSDKFWATDSPIDPFCARLWPIWDTIKKVRVTPKFYPNFSEPLMLRLV
jgi:hypothetical protein